MSKESQQSVPKENCQERQAVVLLHPSSAFCCHQLMMHMHLAMRYKKKWCMYFMMGHILRPYFPFLHRPALTHATLSYSSCGATHRSKKYIFRIPCFIFKYLLYDEIPVSFSCSTSIVSWIYLCPLKVLGVASEGHRHYCTLVVLLHSGGSQKLSKAIKFGFASFYHDQSYTVQAH